MAYKFKKERLIATLFKFSLPIMLAYFVSELYGTIDTFIVARFVGDMATASVSVVYPIQKILIALGIMTSVGTTTALASAVGEGNKEKIQKILTVGLRFHIIFMIAVSLAVFLFHEELLMLVGCSPALMNDASSYLVDILLGMVFLTTTTFIGTVLLSYGESRMALISNIIGATVNAVLDYIFVAHLSMGVNGAGVATLISQIVAFLYAMFKFRKVLKKQGLELQAKLNWKILFAIIAIGVSAFLVESVDGWISAILNSFVSGIAGEKGVLILGVSQRIYMYIFLANFAVASAMQPIVSYAKGAGDEELIAQSVIGANRLAFIVVMISWVVCMIFAPQMIGFFTDDIGILRETTDAFRIMISLVPISSVYYITIFYYQAIKKVKLSLFMSVFRHFGVMLPMAIILTKVFDLGLMGIWLSYPISDFVVGFVSMLMLKGEKLNLRRINLKKEKSAI